MCVAPIGSPGPAPTGSPRFPNCPWFFQVLICRLSESLIFEFRNSGFATSESQCSMFQLFSNVQFPDVSSRFSGFRMFSSRIVGFEGLSFRVPKSRNYTFE